jgi:hypothetical protein
MSLLGCRYYDVVIRMSFRYDVVIGCSYWDVVIGMSLLRCCWNVIGVIGMMLLE